MLSDFSWKAEEDGKVSAFMMDAATANAPLIILAVAVAARSTDDFFMKIDDCSD